MPANFWDNFFASCVALAALLLIMGVAFLLFQFNAVRKKRTYFEKLHKDLAVGEKVQFGGGIFGTVEKVGTEVVSVRVAPEVVLEVSRYAVQSIEAKK